MTQPDQLRDDLAFVRNAVSSQRHAPSPKAILWLWAVYVLVGYVLLDVDYRVGGLFLLIAGPVCGILSGVIGQQAARRGGEMDRSAGRMEALHWAGAFIAIASVVAMAAIHPVLRSNLGGQLIVIGIGLVYYAYGVHRDRHFIWLGLLMIAGAIGLSFVPVYPWTLLGIVLALGLVIPTFFRPKQHETEG